MTTIFHITTREEWTRAIESGLYSAESLATEGFIHCSQIEQVAEVANRLYTGQPNLILLRIEPDRLQAEVRYEGEVELFPHVYGPIDVHAVTGIVDFPPESDGAFRTPA